MTFATAIDLDFDGVSRGVDLLALHADERMQETHRPPQLVIGETKSLGRGELITAKELAKLRSVAAKLPEAVIVIAVLRDHFTVAEKKILAKFVRWGGASTIRRAYQSRDPPHFPRTDHGTLHFIDLEGSWRAAAEIRGLRTYSRVPLCAHEARRNIRRLPLSCRSAMNFVGEPASE